MRLFRRGPDATSVTPPAAATIAVDKYGVIYVDPFCPYCRAPFDPLPKRDRKCPACGQAVARRRDRDDLVRLVRAAEGTSDDQDSQRWTDAKDALFTRKDGRPLRRLNEALLRTYASLGIRVLVVNTESNTVVIGAEDRVKPGASSCRPCRDAAGEYEARSAPLLPLDRCQSRPNRICVCRYELVARDAEHRQ